MTETEWFACTDPTLMLEFLQNKASERKLRLFSCACCRRLWTRWGAESPPKAIEISERLADGIAARGELRLFRAQLGARGGYSAAWAANCASFGVLEEDAATAASNAVRSALDFAYHLVYEQTFSRSTYTGDQIKAKEAKEVEREELSVVVRDVFSNHYRPVAAHSSALWRNDSTVSKLAKGTYDDRAFDRLPFLADALEDSGCTDADILAHCRSAGPHVRGCWVIDLLLGKE